jgi:hypothetical protein
MPCGDCGKSCSGYLCGEDYCCAFFRANFRTCSYCDINNTAAAGDAACEKCVGILNTKYKSVEDIAPIVLKHFPGASEHFVNKIVTRVDNFLLNSFFGYHN